MKIYFAGSVRGAPTDRSILRALISHLRRFGEVLTEHVGDVDEYTNDEPTDREIYERDMYWLGQAEILVAEVTSPSLGVGYEIAKAESLGKPVLCLFREHESRKLSAMIAGNNMITMRTYRTHSDIPSEAFRIIDEYFAEL
jgi:nucleoside 2-deoxyribosyltransferase